jgi:hypothetical protein
LPVWTKEEEILSFGKIYNGYITAPDKPLTKRMLPITDSVKIAVLSDQVKKEFEIVGGVPGYFFDGFQFGCRQIKHALSGVNYADLNKIFEVDADVTTWSVVNRSLLHIKVDVKNNLLQKAFLHYASIYVADCLIEKMMEEHVVLVNKIAFAREEHLNGIIWKTFERLGHEALSAGGRFSVIRLDDNANNKTKEQLEDHRLFTAYEERNIRKKFIIILLKISKILNL